MYVKVPPCTGHLCVMGCVWPCGYVGVCVGMHVVGMSGTCECHGVCVLGTYEVGVGVHACMWVQCWCVVMRVGVGVWVSPCRRVSGCVCTGMCVGLLCQVLCVCVRRGVCVSGSGCVSGSIIACVAVDVLGWMWMSIMAYVCWGAHVSVWVLGCLWVLWCTWVSV